MNDGGERMKERIRYSWISKEEFSCIKCGVGNDYIGWNNKGSDHPVGQPEGVLFCKKCGHELTKKEELEDYVPFVENLEYRFFLRFAKKDFIPCVKCQETIDRLFNNAVVITLISGKVPELILVNGMKVEQDGDKVILRVGEKTNKVTYYFVLPFLYRTIRKDAMTYVPCDQCQEKLSKLLGNANWILGNKDYDEPPIELNRRWVDNNSKEIALEKGQIITVNGKPFGRCRRCKKVKFLAVGKINPKYVVDICNKCLK